MAEKSYHKAIKRNIVSLGKKSGRYKIRIEKKIPLPHPNIERMFFYNPEVHFETKFGKIYIFEILDSQMKDHNLIIADFIQAFISPNVSRIFFIVKSKDDEKEVYKLTSVIGARLEIMGIKEKIPEVTVYTISKGDVKSKKSMKKLEKYAKEDGWY